MSQRLPSLAIVVPNFNHGKYISSALDSIFSQSVPANQVIVVDDGSTDNSLEVIGRYKHEPNLVVIKNPVNLGVSESVKKAWKLLKSEFFYSLAADDILLPRFNEQLLSLAAKFPQAGACVSHPAYMDEHGTIDYHANWAKFSTEPTFFSPEQLVSVIGTGEKALWVAGHSSIFRKNLIDACGGYRSQLRWNSDYFVNNVIALRTGIAYTPEPLAAIRVLVGSYSNSGMNNVIEQAEVLFYMAHLLNSPEFADVKTGFMTSTLLNIFGDQKDYMMAVLRPWGESLLARRKLEKQHQLDAELASQSLKQHIKRYLVRRFRNQFTKSHLSV